MRDDDGEEPLPANRIGIGVDKETDSSLPYLFHRRPLFRSGFRCLDRFPPVGVLEIDDVAYAVMVDEHLG